MYKYIYKQNVLTYLIQMEGPQPVCKHGVM
jgi:hypothetical protein